MRLYKERENHLKIVLAILKNLWDTHRRLESKRRNMSKYDDQLRTWNKECKTKLSDATIALDKECEKDVDSFHRNVLDNIPQQFGDFLYTALGDRVTGQRSSVLNQTYLQLNNTGKHIVDGAKENIQTVEEYAKEQQRSNAGYYSEHAQIYITAGRKFGVSYYTGKNNRTHTIYFGTGQCFKYLTQEHVNCVKNKHKRQCTQDFLDFRNEFVGGLIGLRDQLVEVSIPVELGVLSCITKTKKINQRAGMYNDDSKETFIVMDGVINSKITHMIVTVQPLEIWNRYDVVRSYNVKNDNVSKPSFLSVLFLNIDDNLKHITILGNMDMSVDGSMHSMNGVNGFDKHYVQNHLSCVADYHSGMTHPAIKTSNYAEYKTVESAGVMLNMDTVMANLTVHAEIEKRINFYGEMIGKLQELKHKHSTLYFINADI